MNHVDAMEMSARELLGQISRPIGRTVVDHKRADGSVFHQSGDERRQIPAFVVCGDHHERGCDRHYVANGKLMMSPSWTRYSLPSSRTSPRSRHAAIDPLRMSAS